MGELTGERRGEVEQVIRAGLNEASLIRVTADWPDADFLYALDRLETLREPDNWRELSEIFRRLRSQRGEGAHRAELLATIERQAGEIAALRKQLQDADRDRRRDEADYRAIQDEVRRRESWWKKLSLAVTLVNAVLGWRFFG